MYIIRAAVGARVCGLVSIWNGIFEYGKQTRESITGSRVSQEAQWDVSQWTDSGLRIASASKIVLLVVRKQNCGWR